MRIFSQKPVQAVGGIKPHDLLSPFIESGKALYQLRVDLGGFPSEVTLSRMLRGISPMPDDLADRIRKALEA